jgi:serine/threonine protein kinase
VAGHAAAQVDALHRAGEVHGGLSPGAFTLVETPTGPELGLVEERPGRPPDPYLAPELRSGVFPSQPSATSDLWSLGATLFELVAGEPPTLAPDRPIDGPARPGLRVPDAVGGIVRALLSPDPTRRPTAGEAALALARAERDLAATGEPGLSWERGSLVAHRFRLLERATGGAVVERFEALDERTGERADLVGLVAGLRRDHRHALVFRTTVERARRLDGPHEGVRDLQQDTAGLHFAVCEPRRGVALQGGRVADALGLVRDLAGGLAALHAGGVRAPELARRHVRVDGGRAWLVDIIDATLFANLGEARLRDVSTVSAAPIAPELLGGGEGDERSDLFALGVIAFEALTGEPPFRGARPIEMMKAVLQDDRPRAVELAPGDLGALVDRLLATDPAARPASAVDVLQALG